MTALSLTSCNNVEFRGTTKTRFYIKERISQVILCKFKEEIPKISYEEDVKADFATAFADRMCWHMMKINQASDEARDKQKLDTAIWYPLEYRAALKAKGAPAAKRFEMMQRTGIFYHGMVSKAVAQRIKDDAFPTGYQCFTFKVNDGVLPSALVKTAALGLSILDCGSVRFMTVCLTLIDLLGEDHFNAIFSNPDHSFKIAANMRQLNFLIEDVVLKSEADMQKGDLCYIANIPHYTLKHPIGEGPGFNLICSEAVDSNRIYMGFGLPSKGLNRLEVEQVLFDLFNHSRMDPEELLSKEALSKMYTNYLSGDFETSKKAVAKFKDLQFSWKQFQDEPVKERSLKGKIITQIYRLRFDRIQQLREASVEGVKKLVASWR